MNKKTYVAVSFITLIIFAHPAIAAIPGAYLGGGVGYGNLDNFSDSQKIGSRGGLSGKLFIGCNINQYVGLEVSYIQYKNANYEYNIFDGMTFDYKLNVASLVIKGYAPLMDNGNNQYDLYGFIGLGKADGSADFEYNNSRLKSFSNSVIISVVGIGGNYIINRHFTTSLEYTRTQGKSGDDNHLGIPFSNLVTLNVAYNI